jgi:twinkle protein
LGKIVKYEQCCPDTADCGSSNGMQVYEEGDGFCFVCNNFFTPEQVETRPRSAKGISIKKSPSLTKPKTYEPEEQEGFKKQASLDDISTYPIRGFRERCISKEVTEFFGVRCSYDTAGEIDTHYYPYGEGYNIRGVIDKSFRRQGTFTKLFGQDKFQAGGKRVIITEGEPDAMSVAYASSKKYNKKIYPVVTMGSASNLKMLIEQRDWLRSFDEIVIWFDGDEPGQDAAAKAVKILGLDKCKVAKSDLKDANQILVEKGWEKVLLPVFDAARVIPAGIIGKEALREQLIAYNEMTSLPYPPCMAGVNKKLKGKRLGEITLLISGTGSGKSTLQREDMLYTLEQTPPDVKIGIVSLEESPAETARKLSGMHLMRNPAEEDISMKEILEGFDAVFDSDRILLMDHQGSINDTSIIDKLEYMCLMGCQYIYIDHITILVSEGIEKLTGNEAQDKIMNELLKLVKRYPVWIGLISHLRKTQSGTESFEEGRLPSIDDIRGSGSIKQISFDIIAFARNMTAETEDEKNLIHMSVLKARTTGKTGRVVGARYDHVTGRMVAAGDPDGPIPTAAPPKEEQFHKI